MEKLNFKRQLPVVAVAVRSLSVAQANVIQEDQLSTRKSVKPTKQDLWKGEFLIKLCVYKYL